MQRILFQGDSITDCQRDRKSFINTGKGYAFLVKAALGVKYPQQYEVLNRGIEIIDTPQGAKWRKV